MLIFRLSLSLQKFLEYQIHRYKLNEIHHIEIADILGRVHYVSGSHPIFSGCITASKFFGPFWDLLHALRNTLYGKKVFVKCFTHAGLQGQNQEDRGANCTESSKARHFWKYCDWYALIEKIYETRWCSPSISCRRKFPCFFFLCIFSASK